MAVDTLRAMASVDEHGGDRWRRFEMNGNSGDAGNFPKGAIIYQCKDADFSL